ncbi:MAG TPA: hypothetical protein VMV92_09860 [Streptosporangiaceae bacterium]|nr:hypothetical protein [Streptosporangiaceae bacterium]HUZ35728.1 hypothetical protein [Streptosporangiaceae bacterium]
MTRHLLPAALRAAAAGLLAPEAAVNLLIGHRYWLTRPDFAGKYIDTFPGITDGTAMAAVRWPESVAALDRGQLAGSGSENRILRLAASLADGIPVDLQDALNSLDDTNLQHVVTAIRHAAGRRPDHDRP